MSTPENKDAKAPAEAKAAKEAAAASTDAAATAEETPKQPAASPPPPPPKAEPKTKASKELDEATKAAIKEANRLKAMADWEQRGKKPEYEHSPITGVNTPDFWGDQLDGYNYASVPLFKVESRGGRVETTEIKQRYMNRGWEEAPHDHPAWSTIDRNEMVLMRKPAIASEMAHQAAVDRLNDFMEGSLTSEAEDRPIGDEQNLKIAGTRKPFKDMIDDLPETSGTLALTDAEMQEILDNQ